MSPESYIRLGFTAGCPLDQLQRLISAGALLQPKQLLASAAARSCDRADGPTSIGFDGARCGGKSHWLVAQIGVDDCQRFPGLKCLLLRKVGKSNLENFEDLRRRCARSIDCLPSLQHDPNRPEDILKTDPDESGIGGDDAADALRYMIATQPRKVYVIPLRG